MPGLKGYGWGQGSLHWFSAIFRSRCNVILSGGVSVSVHFSSVVYIRLAGRNGEQQGRFACHGIVYGGSLRSVVHLSVRGCAGQCTARWHLGKGRGRPGPS